MIQQEFSHSMTDSIKADCITPPRYPSRAWTEFVARKMLIVQQRAEVKDYLDIDALLQSGLSLGMMLSAATYLFGAQFNPILTLKALTYFEEGNVPMLPQDARNRLRMHVREAHGRDLPPLEVCIP